MFKKYLDKLEYFVIKDILKNNAQTFEGKELINKLEPYTDKDKVDLKLRETQDGLDLVNSYGSFPISNIDDLTMILKRIESSMSLNAKGLIDIAEVLRNSRELKNYYNKACSDQEKLYDTLNEYFNNLYIDENIESKILNSIQSEDTLSDSASKKLSEIRRTKKNLELEIRNSLNKIIHSNTYSKYIQDNVITIRNGRFVIPVMAEYRSKISGFVHDMSASGSTVYIEPMQVFDSNNKISELDLEEQKEIERILEELSSLLYPIYGSIRETIKTIGILDFVNSKAKLALEMNATKPNIENYIYFKNARHPIINAKKVVPITIYIGNFKNNEIISDFTTLVITGPNTGGKTVSLKTVGLLTLMTQSGLFISCDEGSAIKVFDNVFADIGDEQSIEESLSTFSSHISNIVHILNNFTNDSLILVDELGSGTDPVEGANLAISLLETFHKNGAFTFATTHYHEIKNYCIANEAYMNASFEFDLKELKPTYKLLMGIPGKSNAFEISKKLGVPDEILNRASSLISKDEIDIETLLKQIYDDRKSIEELKEETQKNLNQTVLLRKQLEQENNDKLKNEELKIEKARSEAKEILLNAKEQADEIINKLNKLNAPDIKKAENYRNQLHKKIDSVGANKIDLSALNNLNVKYENIDIKTPKKGTVALNNTKAKDTTTEINIIGETVADGIQEVEKYLDNCKMAGFKYVRIVHGKGTGKLRQGIHDYLKKSSYVKSFRLAAYGEGDNGVTIVELKN